MAKKIGRPSVDVVPGFGARLTRARKLAGVKTQKELAEALDVSQAAVTFWVRGAKMPSTPALIRLARLLNVSTDYLLGLEPLPVAVVDAAYDALCVYPPMVGCQGPLVGPQP